MAGYIKSHSNYRLKTRHQIVSDGVIFERDISTVGGVNTFATGQSTIYQSGNFVVVASNSSPASRHIRKNSWLSPGNNSDIWTEEELANHSSDVRGSVEKSITLKNDFMDLRSFAYYGSLSDLVQNTVANIVTRFPYELYYSMDSDDVEVSMISQGAQVIAANTVEVDGVSYKCLDYILQPRTKLTLETGQTYILVKDSLPNWQIYPGNSISTDFTVKQFKIAKLSSNPDNIVYYHLSNSYKQVSNPGKIDIYSTTSKNSNVDELGHFYDDGYTNYELFLIDPDDTYDFDWLVTPVGGDLCPTPWKKIADIDISVREWSGKIRLHAYWDDNLDVVYLSSYNGIFHIRPKSNKGYYEDFIDNLDLFGKCLMGLYSGVKNTAKFEVLSEGKRGTRKTVETFSIPTAPGGYNIMTGGVAMQNYISNIGKIGVRYDGEYTDNLFRMMTHDSLKNLDWTSNFNGNDGENNIYVETGEKFASVIRVMGYTFDKEKAYIDSIGNTNTITYSNRNNLSDYFLTDALETDGWVVNSVYPYELKEYDSSGKEIPPSSWNPYNQTANQYSRRFGEITGTIIEPYSDDIFPYTKPVYSTCVDGKPIDIDVPNYSGQTYYVEDSKVYNVLSNYFSTEEMTIPEINNEFMKRLKINSKHIFRKKGTIDGIESLMALFGLRSKRWCDENKYINARYDYDIEEISMYAEPFFDQMDNVHLMYKMDWYNSCKTIPYDTLSYINGEYVNYQGLPVAYRDVEVNNETRRKLYPHFSHDGIYDGDMYYQMNGGWLGYTPFRFDKDNKFIMDGHNNETRVETMRNIMQVKNITELLNQPAGDLFENVIYYVNDLSENFAIINGRTYPLLIESIEDTDIYFFNVEVYGGSVSIGGDLYTDILTVSNQDGTEDDYDLSLYEDGTTIKIYYKGNLSDPFTISSNTTRPETMEVFMNGTYLNTDTLAATPTHYFMLNNINYPDLLGDGYWQQIIEEWQIYHRLEDIVDNTLGNNPHSGLYSYDNGKEYVDRFKVLFKYASENRLFNESCFTDIDAAYDEISKYGFEIEETYDSKVHSFIDRMNQNGTITAYNMNSNSSLTSIPDYTFISKYPNSDGVPAQIMNTKKFDLTFYLHADSIYSKEGQEEMKYIQSKVMPYVEQMIPSTSIVQIYFLPAN